MNRTVVLILILTALFLLIACRKDKDPADEPGSRSEEQDVSILEATVIETADGALLVEPVAGSWELRSADRIWVSLRGIEDEATLAYLKSAAAGDRVRIGYDGMIAETYPAQIDRAYSVVPAE